VLPLGSDAKVVLNGDEPGAGTVIAGVPETKLKRTPCSVSALCRTEADVLVRSIVNVVPVTVKTAVAEAGSPLLRVPEPVNVCESALPDADATTIPANAIAARAVWRVTRRIQVFIVIRLMKGLLRGGE
jgi:hypothetical protein